MADKDVDILGYSVFSGTSGECIDAIIDGVQQPGPPTWFACLNPHSFAVARSRKSFAAALRQSDWLVPDGAGIVLAARVLGRPVAERITGHDVFEHCMSRLSQMGERSVFFLGSTEAVLADIRTRCAQNYPGVTVAGTYSPPYREQFSDGEIDAMVVAIQDARPDVLWVGLTAPKQEELIVRILSRTGVRFAGAIGAVFDFYTGRVRRSPAVFQRLGLEWLPRLLQQPRRLWRRTFVSAPIFLWCLLKSRLSIRSRS